MTWLFIFNENNVIIIKLHSANPSLVEVFALICIESP